MAQIMTLEGVDTGATAAARAKAQKMRKVPTAKSGAAAAAAIIKGKKPKTVTEQKPVTVKWMSAFTNMGKKAKLKPTATRVAGFFEAAMEKIAESGAFSRTHAQLQAGVVKKQAVGEEKKTAYRKAALINIDAEIERSKNKIRSDPKGVGRLKEYKKLKGLENLGRRFVANHNIAKLGAIKAEAAVDLLQQAAKEPDDDKRLTLMASANLVREAPIPLKVPAVKRMQIPGVVPMRALLVGKLIFKGGGGPRPMPTEPSEPTAPSADSRLVEEREWREGGYIPTAMPSMMAGLNDVGLEGLLGEFGNFDAFDDPGIWDTVKDAASNVGAAVGGKAAGWVADKIKGAVSGGKKKAEEGAGKKMEAASGKAEKAARKLTAEAKHVGIVGKAAGGVAVGVKGKIGAVVRKRAAEAKVSTEVAPTPPTPSEEKAAEEGKPGIAKYVIPGLLVAGAIGAVALSAGAKKKKEEKEEVGDVEDEG